MSGLEEHPVPDDVDPDGWTLRVTGAVAGPLELDRRALESFPLRTFDEDFACEAGWVAEGLSWRGVPVGAVLERAGVADDAAYGLVHAMDGEYACAFPLADLADAVLALELDGEPLDVAHGGPARLVPTGTDSDCWESVKWVAELELSETEPTDTAKELALSRLE